MDKTFFSNCISWNTQGYLIIFQFHCTSNILIKNSRICYMRGRRQRGGRRAVAPSWGDVSSPSEKKFVSVGEFTTEYCVLMHKKNPIFCYLAPLSRNPALSSGKSWCYPWFHDRFSEGNNSGLRRTWSS